MIGWRAYVRGRIAPVLAALLLLAPAGGRAEPLPDPALHVRLVAQNTPIDVFLQRLAAAAGVSAEASSVSGSISGVFEGRLDAVLAKVSKAFGASYYYDGRTLTLYPATDRLTQTFSLTPAQAARARGQAQREALTDAEDTLQRQGGRLTAVGAPQFITRVQALTRRVADDTPPVTASASPLRAGRRGEAADDPVEYRVFYLHNGWAADTRISSGDRLVTIPGVASILRALVQGVGGGVVSSASERVDSKPATQPGLAGSGLASVGQGGGGDAAAGRKPNTLAELFGLSQAPAATVAPPKARPAPEPETEPRRRASQFGVEAEPRLNALIVRDTRSNLDLYGPLIAALDVEPTPVQIGATIIDVDVERARQAGVNLSFQQPNGSGFSSSLDGAIPNFPQPGGLSVSAVIGDRNSFVAKLEALESRGVARIVSSPLVMTLSDVEATFHNDQTFYVPVSGSLSTDLYNVTVGTSLRVMPHVIRDEAHDRIRLIVQIDDGDVTSQLVGAIPVVHKASLNTEALILSGQSLLVGGMVSQGSTDFRAGVPGVSSVPVLGRLFRASRKTSDHIERLFLITPRVVAVGAPATPPPGARALPPQASLSPAALDEVKR